MKRTVLLAVVALLLAACGDAADVSGTTVDVISTSTGPDSTTTPKGGDTTMPDQPDPIEAATADLAARLSVDASDIVVVKVQAVKWPDGSLGCPQEGELYTQAVVDGQQIFLGHEDRIYDYRADASGSVRFCPSEDKDGGYDFVPPPGAGES